MPDPSRDIELRPAREDDYGFLLDLHRASMREYVSAVWGWDDNFQAKYFREHFKPQRLRVIELDRRAVGVIGLEMDPDRLYIGPFEVLPSMQSRGVGTSVLNEAIRLAMEAGVPAELDVLHVNTRAIRLYQRAGLRVVGETETHLRMRR
jgi:ribosomal protein S18 acetylase RimI-like enzyme